MVRPRRAALAGIQRRGQVLGAVEVSQESSSNKSVNFSPSNGLGSEPIGCHRRRNISPHILKGPENYLTIKPYPGINVGLMTPHLRGLEKNPPCLRDACDIPLDGLRMVHPPHPVPIIRGSHHIREFRTFRVLAGSLSVQNSSHLTVAIN
jgi:hypothetical protein